MLRKENSCFCFVDSAEKTCSLFHQQQYCVDFAETFLEMLVSQPDRIHRSGRRDALYNENLLLRGCTIRNTEEAVGIVIYAG